jgi:hypothetical protein
MAYALHALFRVMNATDRRRLGIWSTFTKGQVVPLLRLAVREVVLYLSHPKAW